MKEKNDISLLGSFQRAGVLIPGSIAVVFLFIAQSFAADQFITVNSENATTNGNAVQINSSNKIYVPLEKKKSYACTLIPRDQSGTLGFDELVSAPSSSLNGDLVGNVTPRVAVGTSDSSYEDNRIAITPSETGEHSFELNRTGGDVFTNYYYSIECLETTLYSAYNTVVNDFNFLETENTSNQDIVVTVMFVNYDDTFDSPTAEVSYTVPANNRVDRNVHDLVGDDKFGLVVLTHNGPYAAIKGRTAQYVGTVDSFSLALAVPLTSRENSR